MIAAYPALFEEFIEQKVTLPIKQFLLREFKVY